MTTNAVLSTLDLLTTTEIYNLTITAKNSSPNDPLLLTITKLIASTLAPLFKIIIDDSLTYGTIPDLLKLSLITPLLKKPKLDKTKLSNYRPISQIPLLAKILEKVVYKQLIKYLTKYNLLDNRQNGFWQGHSTETTLLSLFDDLYTSLANNKSQQLILLELSSVFDRLEFNTIIDRLQNIGLKDIPLLWLKNFLFNRRFTIKISNSISSVQHPIKHGVPQGSVLSPIIFAIFLTPIQHIFNKYPDLNYNLYADDIELHSNIESSDQLQNCLIDSLIFPLLN